MARRPPNADHDSYLRLARACRWPLKLVDRDPAPGEIAKLINVGDQVVNNWKRRGVALPGALAAEAKTGAYACWILSGEGPPADVDWPFPRVDRKRWDACNEADRAEVQGAINQALRECEARREAAEMPQITGRGMLLLPAGPTTGQPDD